MDRSTPGFPVHHQLPSPPKLMSTKSVMPSSRLILCRPLLLLPPIFLSIRVFSSESAVPLRWPEDWSFTLSMSPCSECGCVLSCPVVSDFFRPHGLQPTRLLCPRDSPGRNTPVGCHALLQGIFPTQESHQGLLHYRWILYQQSYQGSWYIYTYSWFMSLYSRD